MSRWIPPVIAALAFFGIGLGLLYRGHPHEDAYILFKYARMWASGEGIVYYPGGPATEGATDFLWLRLVRDLHVLGVDVAIAALIWNTLGAGLASALFVAASRWEQRSRNERLSFGLLAALVPTLPAAHASYVGFSAMLYSAFALLLLHLFVSGGAKHMLALPAVALLVGLLRPDGVVLAVAFSLLGLWPARRMHVTRRYALHCAAAFLLGGAYFLWRWQTFGELLPLPLIVKSHAAAPYPGLAPNLEWFISRFPRFVALVLFLFLVRQAGSSPRLRRLALGYVPFLLLLVALSLGLQTQNVGNRFQAPCLMALQYGFIVLAASPAKKRRRVPLVALVLGLLFAARDGRGLVRYTLEPACRPEYVNGFAAKLPGCLPEGRIALTEAGRLAYWSEAQVIDLVGLNTAEFAHRLVRVADLRALDPDMVIVHVAGLLRTKGLGPRNVVPLEDTLAERIGKQGGQDHVAAAAHAGLTFLARELERYEVYAVRYSGGYNHVIGIRRELPARDCLVRELRASFEASPSYAQLMSAE